jgi:hypothetical protein
MLARVKRDFGIAKLKWHRGMNFQGIKPTVTIRSAAYGNDYALVTKIKTIIDEHLGWQVTLDGKNEPMLPQEGDFKVVFETAFTMSFQEVISAFAVGDLLGETIGSRIETERADHHHLIIQVLPSAMPTGLRG